MISVSVHLLWIQIETLIVACLISQLFISLITLDPGAR